MAKRISVDDQKGIIWFVAFLNISVRETADVYGVSPTSVQRLVRSYQKNPEKFPALLDWAHERNERVTLETVPLEIVPDTGEVYGRDDGVPHGKRTGTVPCTQNRSVLRRLYYLLVATVLVISVVGAYKAFS
jgi:hypothetical protein